MQNLVGWAVCSSHGPGHRMSSWIIVGIDRRIQPVVVHHSFHRHIRLVDQVRPLIRIHIGDWCPSTLPSPSLPSRMVFLAPSLSPLERLRRLDRSSSKFPDQLSSVLSGEEYRQCVPNLQRDGLVWLVDYLDKVRHCIACPHSLLKSA